jgi:hypothetical protein
MAQIANELRIAPAGSVAFAPALPRWRVILWLGALTALAGVVAASYLAYTGTRATASYSIQRLQAERDSWRTRNEQLRVELGKARSLTWVEHEAVSRLKMHKAGALTYLPIDGYDPAASAPPVPGERDTARSR